LRLLFLLLTSQSFLLNLLKDTVTKADDSAALAMRAHKNAREQTTLLKGSLRIRIKQELRAPAKRRKYSKSWLRFGEAYSALRDWRPIPAALLFHSVYFVPEQ
jgi:hypothetical protein